MKPSIFIGSSGEALPLAKAVKEQLTVDFLPDLWSENLFELGEDTLSNLIRFVHCYDFAILVITDDDLTISRKQTQSSPRDNVIFELGLFMGALGRRRSFVLVAKGDEGPPKLPSDLLGNTGVYLPKDLHKTLDADALSQTLKQLIDTVQARYNESSLQLLPSTGLAVGYFENFIMPVCKGLVKATVVNIGEASCDISKRNFDFTVVLPKSLSDALIEGAKKFCDDKGLQAFSVSGETRKYPFYVHSTVESGRIRFFDYPTTLRASHDAVELVLSGPYLGQGKYHAILNEKEISNFERTLRILLQRPAAAGFRENVQIVRLDIE